MNNFDYPIGSDTQDAPWNKPSEPKQVEFTCEVLHELKKVINIPVYQYYENEVMDEDGERFYDVDTSDVDWEQAYKDNCYTINNLLCVLEWYIKNDLERSKGDRQREKELNQILEACKGWKTQNIYIEEL